MISPELPIALIGLRGVGKSSLAGRLANQLSREPHDTDTEIVRLAAARDLVEAGADTGAVLRSLGTAAFRDLEEEVLRDAVGRPGLVIATGGGIVERERSRSLLSQQSFAVWLDAPIEVLAHRIRTDTTDRPALYGGDPVTELPQLAARRAPLFAEVARLRVKVGSLSLPEAVAAILRALQGGDAGAE